MLCAKVRHFDALVRERAGASAWKSYVIYPIESIIIIDDEVYGYIIELHNGGLYEGKQAQI